MEFRILGPIEAEENGLKLDLGGLRERALLARLLLSANRVVSADRLADDLWSGTPPPHSMATLRVYISRLRRALGARADLLVTQAPGYRLNVTDGDAPAAGRVPGRGDVPGQPPRRTALSGAAVTASRQARRAAWCAGT